MEAVFSPYGRELDGLEPPVKACPHVLGTETTTLSAGRPVMGALFKARVHLHQPDEGWLGRVGLVVTWSLWRAIFVRYHRWLDRGSDRGFCDITLVSDGPPVTLPPPPLTRPLVAWEAALLTDPAAAAPYHDWLEEHALRGRAEAIRRLLR